MEITDVTAVCCELPIDLPRLDEERTTREVITTVETDAGFTGYGVSGMQNERSVPAFVNAEIAPLIEGEDPLAIGRIRGRLQSALNQYNHTGVWSSALSSVDIALWDIKGKAFDEPVWRLLGGARESVETMVTPGISDYSEEQLVAVFEDAVAAGHTRLKMQVGRQGPPDPADDESRVRAVRAAVGDTIEIAIDANEHYPVNQAMELCNRVREQDIGFFEEPVLGNNPEALASLRSRSGIPISAGQNEGSLRRHHAFMEHGSVDIVQPNVCFVGGFTEARQVATLAEARNLVVANGGGRGHFNMHLIAAIPNGWCVEFNPLSWTALNRVFPDLQSPAAGQMRLPETPGLGLEADAAALEEYRIG